MKRYQELKSQWRDFFIKINFNIKSSEVLREGKDFKEEIEKELRKLNIIFEVLWYISLIIGTILTCYIFYCFI